MKSRFWSDAKERWLRDDVSAPGELGEALGAMARGKSIAEEQPRGETLIVWRFTCTPRQAEVLLDRARQLARGFTGSNDHVTGLYLKAVQQIQAAL